jgi:hypothetical protein
MLAFNAARYVSPIVCLNKHRLRSAFSWPSPNASSTPTFTQPSLTSGLSDRFLQLPTEIRLEILRELPIRDLLALSSASRSLRASITEPAFLNQVIKEAVLMGSEFWILPVAAIPGEVERAWEVANQWLKMASLNRAREVQPTKSPFNSPSFPFVAFVHACYGSDSMRNRQRFWNIVKQFDGIWRDYRLNGWQRVIFSFYGEAPLDTSDRRVQLRALLSIGIEIDYYSQIVSCYQSMTTESPFTFNVLFIA